MNVQKSVLCKVLCGDFTPHDFSRLASLAFRAKRLIAGCGLLLAGLALPLSAATTPLKITSVTPRDGKVIVTWEGGTPPFQLLCRTNYTDEWRKVGQPTSARSATNSAPSGPMCFFMVTTDVIAPDAPTGLKALTSGCGSSLVFWTASANDGGGSGLKGYNIYRGGVFVRQVLAPVVSSLQDGLSPATTYVFGVSAVDNAGNESTQALSIVTTVACANMRPLANAGPNQTNLVGYANAFDGSSSRDPDGTISSYSWNFGDGTTGSGINPSHLYANAGTYTVTLTVTDNLGLSGTDTAIFIVNQPPVASSGADKTNVVGAAVVFDGSGSWDPDGAIVYHLWRFDDGSISTNATASHVYTAAGTYPVTLYIRDNFRASARTNVQVTILSNQAPVANAGPALSGKVGIAVVFDGSRSWDPDGTIVSCTWRFGDGMVDSGTNIAVSHVYTNAGTWTTTLTVMDNAGASATDTAVVTVAPAAIQPPIASAGSDQTASVGTSVSFSGSGSSDPDGTISSFVWDFGDGSSGSGISVAHAYTSAGTFIARLTVTDNSGATASDTAVVTMLAPTNQFPIANAGPDKSGMAGTSITFGGFSSLDPDGTISGYVWTFGDNASAVGVSVSHAYASAGSFTVRLTVTDNLGAAASDTAVVTVSAAPTNQFPAANAGPDKSGTVGTSIPFSGSGSQDPDGTVNSYAWTFGDGATGSGVSVSHAYASSGFYTVRLTVTDNSGATASDTAQVAIEAANQPPIANAGPDKTAKTGTAVSFSGSGSSDPDGTISSYAWTFGDGATGSGVSVSHAYASAGTYTARLTVTDNSGATASDTAVVTLTATNQFPVANAGPDKSATVGTSAAFSGSSSLDPDGTISSYAWTFGDGATGSGVSVSHAYTSAGTYTARLTVTDNSGATASDTAVVTISATNKFPVANAGPDKSATVGTSVSFSGSSSQDPDGTISSYAWTFGDGATGSGVSVSHAYASAGTYTARLTVTDNSGATASDTAVVTITAANQFPVANAGTDKSAAVGTSVSFSGASSLDPDGTIGSYAWTFGDGATGSGVSVSHAYASAGNYTARLTVTDNSGAAASDTAVVTITTPVTNQFPVANAGSDKSATVGASVSFSGASSLDPDGTISSYAWTFGDGATGSGVSVSHAYASAGTYTARLTVTDNSGATASDTAVVTVTTPTTNQFPVANAGADKSATVGTSVSFSGASSLDPDGTISSYAWTFGDGATGSGVSVSHAYASAGTYTVQLTITDNSGANASDLSVVNISGTGSSGQVLSVKAFGAGLNDSGQAVAVDRSGNVIIGGSGNPFLAKRSPSGEVAWSLNINANAYAVAVDSNGDILVTGCFLTFAGYPGLDFGGVTLNSAGGYDIFLAKYTSAGALVWAKRFGGPTFIVDIPSETGLGIAVDTNDNSVVVTGNYDSTIDFGGGPLTIASGATGDFFLAKFRSDGTYAWARRGGASWGIQGKALAIDSNGNIFFTGDFTGTVNFGGGPITSIQGGELFIVKYTANGAFLWLDHFGPNCHGRAIAVDRLGDVVVTGTGGGNLGGAVLAGFGMDDIVLAKYSGQDGRHLWSKSFGGTLQDYGHGVAISTDGTITLTGRIQGSVNFGGGQLAAGPGRNVFVASFTTDGAHRWSKAFGYATAPSVEEGRGVAVDANGHLFVVGIFSRTVNFGGQTLTSASTSVDMFLAEFAP